MTYKHAARHLGYWGLPLAYAALIFYLSHQPTVPGPALPVSDKVLHIVEYAILAFLIARALTGSVEAAKITRGSVAAAGMSRGSFAFGLKRGLAAVALTALYGASDEWHQSFIPGRSPEFADWLADVAGACLGILIFYFVGRFLAKAQNTSR